MPKPFGYFVNLPKGQISAEPGADDANKNELLAFLKNEELTKQYAEKEGVERIDAGSQTMEEIFLIDLPNGIFKADTPEQHKALMNNLQSMKDAELLRPLATKVLQPAVAVAAPPAQTIVQVVSPLQQQLGVQDVLGYDKELRKMEEVKSLYHAGLALTLSQANEAYIKYSFDNKPEKQNTIKDYRSRMNSIIEIVGDRYLHELEEDDVVQIEKTLMDTPTSRPQKKIVAKKKSNEDEKPEVLKRRTVCDEKSEAFKAGYKSIADISKERIRRAGQRIKTENLLAIPDLEIGFRVLKIDTSNMADVYYSPDALEKTKFDMFVDNIKPDRSAEDLLFQVMLDWGVDLALPISKETIQGKEVFFVDGNALAACFDASSGVDEDFVKALAKYQPLRVVFRDAGFKDSAVKINVEQIFKQLSPSTEVKCL